jgi:hypothetical protein
MPAGGNEGLGGVGKRVYEGVFSEGRGVWVWSCWVGLESAYYLLPASASGACTVLCCGCFLVCLFLV